MGSEFELSISKYHSTNVVSIEIESSEGKVYFRGEMTTENFANTVLGLANQPITPKHIIKGKLEEI